MLVRTFRRGLNMLKFKFLPLLGALAVAALTAGATTPAMADEIYFGSLPLPSGCATNKVGTDEGFVCSTNQTFSAEGSTFTATGFSDTTFTNSSALTVKDVASNGNNESGLGENATGPNTLGAGGTNTQACTDNAGAGASTPCEIGINTSVKLTSTVAITDLLVGSVQAPEIFDVYAGPNGGSLSLFQSNVTAGTCTAGPDGSECLITGFAAGTFAVGIVDLPSNPTGQASDVLVTAVSIVPAPPIGQGLPAVIAVGGLLFGVWAWDRSKKRRLLGAAIISHAAA
jgi:hypothetical protein